MYWSASCWGHDRGEEGKKELLSPRSCPTSVYTLQMLGWLEVGSKLLQLLQ